MYYALLFLLYFLPTIIAFARSVPNAASVLVINFFLGWTFVGWVVALAMSTRSHAPTIQIQNTNTMHAVTRQHPHDPYTPPSQ